MTDQQSNSAKVKSEKPYFKGSWEDIATNALKRSSNFSI